MKKLVILMTVVAVCGMANADLMLKLVGSDFDGTTWTDTSGQGNDATVWTGAPVAGGGVVTFDGDDGLELASEIFPTSDADGFTVMLAIKNDNDTWSTPVSPLASGGYMVQFSGDQQLYAVRANQAALGANDTPVSGYNILTNRTNDAGGIFRLNGVADGTNAGSSFAASGIGLIGTIMKAYTSERFIGSIAELRVYNTQLTEAEMAEAEASMFVPEPATMLLLGLGGLLIRRKR